MNLWPELANHELVLLVRLAQLAATDMVYGTSVHYQAALLLNVQPPFLGEDLSVVCP